MAPPTAWPCSNTIERKRIEKPFVCLVKAVALLARPTTRWADEPMNRMMAIESSEKKRGNLLITRLIDALVDPTRQERSAALALGGYVALWTLYGVLTKGNQDIHVDMSEQYVLARELAWGYPKHPPLAMVVVRAWFSIFPTADWAYYLLAMATVGLTLWIAWRIAAPFLDGEKRVVGLALLTLVPFFNFHALKFNNNTVLMPLWAATTLWFLRSYSTRRPLDAALAGLAAALSMYGKYWSIFLLLGLAIAALADRRRAAYFRSSAPYITIAIGTLAIAPHAAWLVANDFAPFSYAVVVHGTAPLASAIGGAVKYLLGAIAYVALPLVVLAVTARPSRAAVADMARPVAPERRLAALAFWTVLLMPALVAPLARIHLASIWTMSALTLLPVMLLSTPLVAVGRRNAERVLALAVAFPITMAAIAPAIAFIAHRADPPSAISHSSLLANPVERLWRDTTHRPLRLFASVNELTNGIAFYLPSHPLGLHALESLASSSDEGRMDRDGVVLLCPVSASACVDNAEARARCFPAGQRAEVEVARSHFGMTGKPARYLLISIPPRAEARLQSLREPVAAHAAPIFEPVPSAPASGRLQ